MKRAAICVLVLFAGCAADRPVDRVLNTPDGKELHCITQPDGYLVKCGAVMLDTSPRPAEHSEKKSDDSEP